MSLIRPNSFKENGHLTRESIAVSQIEVVDEI